MRSFDFIDQNRIIFEAVAAEAILAEVGRRKAKQVSVARDSGSDRTMPKQYARRDRIFGAVLDAGAFGE
jgi:hypothetical protein